MNTAIEVLAIIVIGAICSSIFIALWEWGKRSARKDNPVAQGADAVADAVAKMVVEQFGSQLDTMRDVEGLTEQKLRLESQLVALRREKEEIEQVFAQKERTLDHAAGLLRKELDVELDHAKAEAKHEADQRILIKEREFNKQQLDATEARFKGELATLNGLVTTLTERLPDVSARLRLKGEV